MAEDPAAEDHIHVNRSATWRTWLLKTDQALRRQCIFRDRTDLFDETDDCPNESLLVAICAIFWSLKLGEIHAGQIL